MHVREELTPSFLLCFSALVDFLSTQDVKYVSPTIVQLGMKDSRDFPHQQQADCMEFFVESRRVSDS